MSLSKIFGLLMLTSFVFFTCLMAVELQVEPPAFFETSQALARILRDIATHCPRPLGRGRRPEAGRGGGYK